MMDTNDMLMTVVSAVTITAAAPRMTVMIVMVMLVTLVTKTK